MIHVLEVVVSSAVCTWVSCWGKLLTHVLLPPTFSYPSTYVGIMLFVLINNLIGAFQCFNSCFNHSFLIDGEWRGGRSRGILCKVQKLVSNVTGLIHVFEFT